jgi:CBS domain-containing protein
VTAIDDTPVSAAMRKWVITVQPDTSLASVAQIMRLGRLRALPVVGPDRELLGALTFRACCAFVAEAINGSSEDELRDSLRKALSARVDERMSDPEDVIAADANLREGLRALGRASSGHLLVVSPEDPRRLVGVLTEADLLRRVETFLA